MSVPLIVLAVFVFAFFGFFFAKLLEVLNEIAYSLGPSPNPPEPSEEIATRDEIVARLLEFGQNIRKDIDERDAEMLEFVKKEISRLDRTIEMGSVRPRRGASPTQGPENPTPPSGDSATEPIEIDPLAIEYRCACGWVGQFASCREDDHKNYCPRCSKELPP